MKNKLNITIVAILAAVVMFSLLSFKGEKPKTETKIVTDTKCFVHYSMNTIKVYIDTYTKNGYTVKQIVSQNVSTSIDEYYHQFTKPNFRDLKGDIILVLEKQTTVTVTTK